MYYIVFIPQNLVTEYRVSFNRKAYAKTWYQTNKHRIDSKQKEYYRAHKERYAVYQHQYYLKRKEQISVYHKANRKINPEKYYQKSKKDWERVRSKLIEVLGQAACVRCGFYDVRALQFDHN
jgi:hypothetical protein